MTQIDERVEHTPPEGTENVLSIADPSGDVRVMWDPRIPAEVEAAENSFKKAKKKGMLAYSVDPNTGAKGEVIREFDPEASKVIMTMPLAGG